MKKFFHLIPFLTLALAISIVPVQAETADLNQSGTIIISTSQGQDLGGMDFGLYQIAVLHEAENEVYEYEVNSAFKKANLNLEEENVSSADFMAQIERYIEKNNVEADWVLKASDTDLSQENPLRFENLQPGIYYCTQLENEAAGWSVSSFVVGLPYEGQYEVTTYLKGIELVRKEPNQDSSAPGVNDTSTSDKKTDSSIPFTGTYSYMILYLLGAGFALLLTGTYFLISSRQYA